MQIQKQNFTNASRQQCHRIVTCFEIQRVGILTYLTEEEILEKVEMNVVIQENTMPIAALKYANDPKFTYFMKIKEQMSLALPLLAKVVNKQLSLHNYKLGAEHCAAFAETCKFN